MLSLYMKMYVYIYITYITLDKYVDMYVYICKRIYMYKCTRIYNFNIYICRIFTNI